MAENRRQISAPDVKLDNLPLKMVSPLGENLLAVKKFTAKEIISDLFQIEVDLIWLGEEFEFSAILGKEVSISIRLNRDDERFFSGIVSRFSEIEQTAGIRTFRAEVVPWLYFATLRTNCRIFQDKTIPEIVDQVLGDLPLSDFEFKIEQTYQPLPYCVQYRETDFAFISRLLEQAGIFYHFVHEWNRHQMVLNDSPGSRKEVPFIGGPLVYAADEGDNFSTAHVSHFNYGQMLRPGKHAITDYNFLDPNTGLLAEGLSSLEIEGMDENEIFDYPGNFIKTGEEGTGKLEQSDAEVMLRTQQSDALFTKIDGKSIVDKLTPGFLFNLVEHPNSAFNDAYFLTSVHHWASQARYFVQDEPDRQEYKNHFEGVPGSVVYRPARKTRRALVTGPQTAVVVGPSNEEIYTDKYGRVKVQFHWDRYGQKNENSSCWVRVVQNWAGKNWGALFHPRIGQEVVINFLEGDPDRPIITGRVYNAEQPIPYTTASQSGIKSRSTKEGTADNFNEIRFEDKKGSEELYIQAEKNQDILVKANKTETVGANETRTIGADQKESIGENRTGEVGQDRNETIGAKDTLTVGDERNHTIGKDENVTIGQSQTVAISTDRTLSIGSDDTQSIAGKSVIDVGANLTTTIGSDYTVKAGSNGTINVGKKLTIEAGDQITVKVGKASITLKKNGEITLKGKDLKLDGSGKITVKAAMDLTLKGSKVQSN